MTEYEIADLAAAQFDRLVVLLDVLGTHLSIYLTIISGYLIVAYVVGGKLSRLQVWMVSALYFAAALFEALLIAGLTSGIIDMISYLVTVDEKIDDAWVITMGGQYLGLSVLVAALILPLWFMWNIRRNTSRVSV